MGKVYWVGEIDINVCLIGIEIVNFGYEWGYKDFLDL